jgi:hypothetical protein
MEKSQLQTVLEDAGYGCFGMADTSYIAIVARHASEAEAIAALLHGHDLYDQHKHGMRSQASESLDQVVFYFENTVFVGSPPIDSRVEKLLREIFCNQT